MSETNSRDQWRRAMGAAIGISLAVCGLVLAFLWPAMTSEVREIPVAVAGPGAEELAAAVEQNAGDRFDLSTTTDRDAAVAQIEQREVYGAIVVGTEPEVLIASAASPSVAQVLTALAPQLEAQLQAVADTQAEAAGGAAPEVTVAVTNVVPLADSDPNGTGLAAAGFPMMFGGLFGGIGLALAISGTGRRATTLVVYSAVAGLLITAVLQSWFGILQGSYLVNAGAYALTFAAMGAPILGAFALFGRGGLAFGPLVFMLFANPIASAGMPTQFLPGVWGTVGQLFPPGASATLVRTLSYFPDATTARPVLVLTCWAVAGFAVALVAGRRRASRVVPQPVPAAVAA